MSLVPIIDNLESAILRGESVKPLLALLREQAEALDSELSTLKAEKEDARLEARAVEAETQMQAIQATLDEAMAEINRLRTNAGEKEWHAGKHQEKQWEVLRFLGDGITRTEKEIAARFGFSPILASYHLLKLCSEGKIIGKIPPYSDPRNFDRLWVISHPGMDFLAERGELE